MSFFSKLFGGSPSGQHIDTDMELVVAYVKRNVEIINESLHIANDSNNPETKLSRLDLAKEKLTHLKQLADENSFLSLTSLNDVEASIRSLEREFASSGLQDIVDGNSAGYIGYYKLEDWWNSNFTDDERKYINNKFEPMGQAKNILISGDGTSSQSAIAFLYTLSGWFSSKENRSIALRILDKSGSMVDNATSVLDMHFLYSYQISLYYKERSDPAYFDKAMDACKRQIEMTDQSVAAFRKDYRSSDLPGHKGFTQLAIVWEKEKKFESAITLCKRASDLGWSGDWDKRIERCSKKLNN